MRLVAALAGFVLLMLFDLPALIRGRRYRELAVFAVIAALAGVYLVFFVLDLETFSFIKAISQFAEKTLKLDYSLWQGTA